MISDIPKYCRTCCITGYHLTKLDYEKIKASSDVSHFILEINVGKSRIRHTTTLKLSNEFLDRLKIEFRVVLCRIRFFPRLNSKNGLGLDYP